MWYLPIDKHLLLHAHQSGWDYVSNEPKIQSKSRRNSVHPETKNGYNLKLKTADNRLKINDTCTEE
ncbi:hypothetical protein PGT21_005779 [Puccinia graminis f. sp. tritici]|uniref:Uncharacterized protein n=1 Tax=Puccinia graminis f. sp. tritici TaxID=56615 RepID=A0A5B0MX58_PUCGR|nr:hypothetical protein PGT21_005779 [Puccinia graminis f. sp. tritici]KAA1120438.1 hypothetical protein PGTUg99_018346 [Puccinia graminis f. sp. tritici]